MQLELPYTQNDSPWHSGLKHCCTCTPWNPAYVSQCPHCWKPTKIGWFYLITYGWVTTSNMWVRTNKSDYLKLYVETSPEQLNY